MRYALTSPEELWVIACYKFFEEYGFLSWYKTNKHDALRHMMQTSKGKMDPSFLKSKIDELYNGVGL
jgi:hypothetical protein